MAAVPCIMGQILDETRTRSMDPQCENVFQNPYKTHQSNNKKGTITLQLV